MAFSGSTLFAGTGGGSAGVFTSTDNGDNWTAAACNGLTYRVVYSLLFISSTLYAGTSHGVFSSTDNGANWTDVGQNGLTYGQVNALVYHNSVLYAGTNGGRVFESTDLGADWSAAPMNSSIAAGYITGLVFCDTVLFICSYGVNGMYRSYDQGSTCLVDTGGINNFSFESLATDDVYLIGGQSNGAFVRTLTDILPVELTSFSGSSNKNSVELKWNTATEVNNSGFEIDRSGSSSIWMNAGFVQGSGTSNAPKEYSFVDNNVPVGKYSYRLKQIDRDGLFKFSQTIEVDVNTAPTQFTIDQNYPNPTNPSTKISYTIPNRTHVTLSVFNTLGQKVAELVNGDKDAGAYSVTFDASGLASGVYLYRMEAGGFVQQRSW